MKIWMVSGIIYSSLYIFLINKKDDDGIPELVPEDEPFFEDNQNDYEMEGMFYKFLSRSRLFTRSIKL